MIIATILLLLIKSTTSNVEAYKDYENIMRGIWSKWLWNSYEKEMNIGVKGTFSFLLNK